MLLLFAKSINVDENIDICCIDKKIIKSRMCTRLCVKSVLIPFNFRTKLYKMGKTGIVSDKQL